MKNKISKAYLALLVCCLLAGCAADITVPTHKESSCQHQWSQADCINASVCTLCGEVQGEALGHCWIEATCEMAEHCSLCGETRGEALSHGYGKWLLDREEMYRICTFCQHTESAEIDYAAYLDQHIYGHWNMCAKIENTKYYEADLLSKSEADIELCFYEDGRIASLGFEEEEISSGWSLDYGEYDPRSKQHRIYLSFPENNMLSDACITCFGEEITYEIPLNNMGDKLFLSNSFGDDIAALLNGTWSAWAHDGIYSISFLEDRSFTADVDGEISGFWQPRKPLDSKDSSGSAYIMLNYYKDGNKHSECAKLMNFFLNYSQESQKDSLMLSADVNNDSVYFALDAKQFLTDALDMADSAHLGTWTSTRYVVSTYNSDTFSSNTEKDFSTEYSITFMDDGSFSANLHEELKGYWQLEELRKENKRVCLIYKLSAPGMKYFDFQMYDDGEGLVSFYTEDKNSADYYLLKMNEDEIAARNELVAAAPTMLAGEWFSIDDQQLTAVFNEDGSFVINSDYEKPVCEGLWYFTTMDNYGDTYYYYGLVIYEDGEAFTEDYALMLELENGIFTLELMSNFVSGTLTNAEGLAASEEAVKAIAGHWQATTGQKYNVQLGTSKEVTVNAYLDIAEDGSFTGYAFQELQGTMRYSHTDEDTVYYRIYLEKGPDIHTTFFTLTDGCLEGNLDNCFFSFSK